MVPDFFHGKVMQDMSQVMAFIAQFPTDKVWLRFASNVVSCCQLSRPASDVKKSAACVCKHVAAGLL